MFWLIFWNHSHGRSKNAPECHVYNVTASLINECLHQRNVLSFSTVLGTKVKIVHICYSSFVLIAQICCDLACAIFARYLGHARMVESCSCAVMHILQDSCNLDILSHVNFPRCLLLLQGANYCLFNYSFLHNLLDLQMHGYRKHGQRSWQCHQ